MCCVLRDIYLEIKQFKLQTFKRGIGAATKFLKSCTDGYVCKVRMTRVPYPLTLMRYSLSLILYPLSRILYPLSLIPYTLSFTPYPFWLSRSRIDKGYV
jgi:hypothetical protein